MIRFVLVALVAQTDSAFVFGSVAKSENTAKSDIDLTVVSEKLAYADRFTAMEPATNRLGRT
ncbi:MAG: nucleotidyltransferase domain-containing protein, partial [Gemmatimonadales bacterium]